MSRPSARPRTGLAPAATDRWSLGASEGGYEIAYPHRGPAEAEAQLAGILGFLGLKRAGPGSTFLDLGCGRGRLVRVARAAGLLAVGSDRSRSALAAARRRRAGPVVRGEHARLPFANACFDLAVSLFSSVGHGGLEGLGTELAELRRCLRPGGNLVLDLPEPGHLERTLVPVGLRRIGGLTVHERRRLAPGGADRPARVSKRVVVVRGNLRVAHWFEHLELASAERLEALAAGVGLERVRAVPGSRVGGFDRSRLLLFARAPGPLRSLS